MPVRLIIAFPLLLCLFISCVAKPSPLEKRLDTLFRESDFSGVVLVSRGDTAVYRRAFGTSDRAWDVPNTMRTRFRIASLTKSFTAAMVLQLADNYKLKLTDPVTTFFPRYRRWRGVTVHHLLTHTSGIRDVFALFSANDLRYAYEPKRLMDRIHRYPLLFTPGSKHAYSNFGYFLLGMIIEKTTGRPFAANLQERILTPLKLNNTGFFHNRDVVPRLAESYYRLEDGSMERSPYIDLSMLYTAAGMYSTADDLLTWCRALDRPSLMSRAFLDKMFSPHVKAYFPGMKGLWYAYGWRIHQDKEAAPAKAVYHTGKLGAANGIIYRVPPEKLTVIILANTLSKEKDDLSDILSTYIPAVYEAVSGSAPSDTGLTTPDN